MTRTLAVTLSLLAFSAIALPQSVATTPTSTATTSDPQALTLAAAAMAALTGGQQVSDVTLTGTATETAGATINSGTATFKAKGYWESRIDFGGSSHSEIRTLDSSGNPTGAWTGSDGVSHPMALHNVWTDGAWFFPAFSSVSAASQPNVIAKYIGKETRNGSAVQHLEFFRNADPSLFANDLPRFSTVDVYLDAASNLPVTLTYYSYADNDANTNIATEIDFSNYQEVGGVGIPFHVQKLFSGNVIVDLQVLQASLNGGLSDSAFSIQ